MTSMLVTLEISCDGEKADAYLLNFAGGRCEAVALVDLRPCRGDSGRLTARRLPNRLAASLLRPRGPSTRHWRIVDEAVRALEVGGVPQQLAALFEQIDPRLFADQPSPTARLKHFSTILRLEARLPAARVARVGWGRYEACPTGSNAQGSDDRPRPAPQIRVALPARAAR